MTTPTTISARALLLAALLGLAGCGAAASSEASDGGIFLAVASDFADFASWQSNTTDTPVASGSTHVTGRRTVYINAMPPPGTAEFPVGTLIVKVTEADGKIFARAKRGGNFNKSGALNWEWYELEEGSSGLSVRWHGWGPPAGEMYGGDAGGACNGCHLAAAPNDYVMSPWLTLTPAAGSDGGADATDAGGE
jgi:hypothetical protein